MFFYNFAIAKGKITLMYNKKNEVMRKIMSIVFAGIFIMPLLCESYGSMVAEVYKNTVRIRV